MVSENGAFDEFLCPQRPTKNISQAVENALKLAAETSGLEEMENLFDEDAEKIVFWWGMVLPLMAPGQVLIVQVTGTEKHRYLIGYSEAYVRDEGAKSRSRRCVSMTSTPRPSRRFRVPQIWRYLSPVTDGHSAWTGPLLGLSADELTLFYF